MPTSSSHLSPAPTSLQATHQTPLSAVQRADLLFQHYGLYCYSEYSLPFLLQMIFFYLFFKIYSQSQISYCGLLRKKEQSSLSPLESSGIPHRSGEQKLRKGTQKCPRPQPHIAVPPAGTVPTLLAHVALPRGPLTGNLGDSISPIVTRECTMEEAPLEAAPQPCR